ncbi:MAG: type II secretion system GspH family protein [Candidatus Peribacteria bacterium]|jgi:prepilin-type N-terminal cleavage/methylation domain-containing protein|nr:type II secretion system GspH family protein [Candidatus Peribacteria bacterium]
MNKINQMYRGHNVAKNVNSHPNHNLTERGNVPLCPSDISPYKGATEQVPPLSKGRLGGVKLGVVFTSLSERIGLGEVKTGFSRAFTLVELIVVISILAIL